MVVKQIILISISLKQQTFIISQFRGSGINQAAQLSNFASSLSWSYGKTAGQGGSNLKAPLGLKNPL